MELNKKFYLENQQLIIDSASSYYNPNKSNPNESNDQDIAKC
ncbi:1757_t:CDS:2 [Gigaspora margarita]|uniref:1757_t:CDS:1 n=1 Tax=Gigaspora margarita TaxID=4874 RepID=A0ABN7UV37_GIGMA|nr:1757_t:CDS:2 [Gigaspora margarita]